MTDEQLKSANEIVEKIENLDKQIKFINDYINSNDKKPAVLELRCIRPNNQRYSEQRFQHSILQEEIVPILLFAKQKRKRILETKLKEL